MSAVRSNAVIGASRWLDASRLAGTSRQSAIANSTIFVSGFIVSSQSGILRTSPHAQQTARLAPQKVTSRKESSKKRSATFSSVRLVPSHGMYGMAQRLDWGEQSFCVLEGTPTSVPEPAQNIRASS